MQAPQEGDLQWISFLTIVGALPVRMVFTPWALPIGTMPAIGGPSKAMPRYRIRHRPTGAFRELEAPFAQDACTLAGWMIGDCHVELIRDGPLTYPDRPERLVLHSQDLTELQQRMDASRGALVRIRSYAASALGWAGEHPTEEHYRNIIRLIQDVAIATLDKLPEDP
jgi:hypothetical protein